jgi:hypothetical protein
VLTAYDGRLSAGTCSQPSLACYPVQNRSIAATPNCASAARESGWKSTMMTMFQSSPTRLANVLGQPLVNRHHGSHRPRREDVHDAIGRANRGDSAVYALR